MLDGPSKTASLSEILREVTRARVEAKLAAPSRGTRFHEHLARTPADEPVPFDAFLNRQNRELRAARARLDWCPPKTGRVIDIYG
jgi:hypothetical protein